MEIVHVETSYKGEIIVSKEFIEKLPQKIILCSIVQYLEVLDQIENQLKAAGKEVERFKSIHGSKQGQILGCDVYKVPGEFDCFLFIGDGLFHPTALLYKNEKPVFAYSPIQNTWKEYSKNDLEHVHKRRKAGLTKFYHANKVGILITSKIGQKGVQSQKIKEIETMFPEKEFYYFLSDTINTQELENFPFIESWVNTACPRIIEDDRLIVNLRDILVMQKQV